MVLKVQQTIDVVPEEWLLWKGDQEISRWVHHIDMNSTRSKKIKHLVQTISEFEIESETQLTRKSIL